MPRRKRLERKLFGWLAALALLPTLAVLLVALAVGSRSLHGLGTLGPWAGVAESGRALIDAAEAADSLGGPLRTAADRHRNDLSESLRQAGRWTFIGERINAAAPIVVAALAVFLAVLALLISRRLARELARPIGELVDWAGRLGRGEPLPGPEAVPGREVVEVAVLRDALRSAESAIREGRRRALEVERTKAWGEMARRVAHEMKNPLTPLRLAAHRLDQAAESDPSLRDTVEVIREETTRLDELARSFAALGRPASGPLSEVDLGELIDKLLESDVPDGIRCSLEAEPGLPTVMADYEALARAFRNLVRNAVEAMGHRRGSGVIEVRATADGADGVRVVVADDGVGIPEGLEDVIFEPDRSLKRGGTGLGLAVVRQVVAAHGGAISARNRDGGGAAFEIRLPRQPPTAAPSK
ncbi:MAG: ATP-binding protein [Gemmatimonadota bacterium]|jgi:signal transduction histidine kinase